MITIPMAMEACYKDRVFDQVDCRERHAIGVVLPKRRAVPWDGRFSGAVQESLGLAYLGSLVSRQRAVSHDTECAEHAQILASRVLIG
jgi:hypothetical protein